MAYCSGKQSKCTQLALVKFNITVYSAALIIYCLINRIVKPYIEFVFSNIPLPIDIFFRFMKPRSTNFCIFEEQALSSCYFLFCNIGRGKCLTALML